MWVISCDICISLVIEKHESNLLEGHGWPSLQCRARKEISGLRLCSVSVPYVRSHTAAFYSLYKVPRPQPQPLLIWDLSLALKQFCAHQPTAIMARGGGRVTRLEPP